MDRGGLADLFARIAFAIEVTGNAAEDAKLWQRASRSVWQTKGDVMAAFSRGEPVEGVAGDAYQTAVDALALRPIPILGRVEASIPPGIFDIKRIKGLGPAKIRALWTELGITTLGELEHACRENRLVALKGFGLKTQGNVLLAIDELRSADALLLRDRAASIARNAVQTLASHGVRSATIGELARGFELVSDLSILVEARSETPGALEAIKSTGVPLHALRIVTALPASFGVAHVHATSSAAHWAALKAHAEKSGLTLTDEELTRDGATVSVPTEDALYDHLALLTTPAERRDDGVPLVLRGHAEPKLVTLRDLRGALHNHTIASDGTATLEEMQAAAEEFGLEYLGISEHSQSASYAGGLSPQRLLEQASMISNASGSKCALLSGVESDIREDGTLDYPDDVLDQIDVCVASVHQRHRLAFDASTARIERAAAHPRTDILGHPTGRLLLGRPENEFDVVRVLLALKKNGSAVELNASPHRLDLGVTNLGLAREMGVPISIAADAHATSELAYLEHGVAVARRAGVLVEEVLNARSLLELRAWLIDRRRAAGETSRLIPPPIPT